MRVSVDRGDPGCSNSVPFAKVFFDGAEVSGVITADEEKRMILQYVTDSEGRFQLNEARTEVLAQKRYGHVRIELP